MPQFVPMLTLESLCDPAHHGTSRGAANSILCSAFNRSVGRDTYLGEGVYFFDANEEAAVNWAKHRRDEAGWAVLDATVHLGTCLNLTVNTHCRLVQQMARELTAQGIPDVTEAVAINALVALSRRKGTDIQTIKAVQVPEHPAPLVEGSRFFMGYFLVICVVETSMISNVRLGRTGT